MYEIYQMELQPGRGTIHSIHQETDWINYTAPRASMGQHSRQSK